MALGVQNILHKFGPSKFNLTEEQSTLFCSGHVMHSKIPTSFSSLFVNTILWNLLSSPGLSHALLSCQLAPCCGLLAKLPLAVCSRFEYRGFIYHHRSKVSLPCHSPFGVKHQCRLFWAQESLTTPTYSRWIQPLQQHP